MHGHTNVKKIYYLLKENESSSIELLYLVIFVNYSHQIVYLI